MRFKYWINEILAGPGNGPMPDPIDQVAYTKSLIAKGAGAFPTIGDDPPKIGVNPTKKYEPKAKLMLDKRYQKKV